jgi:lysophospholipase L1-like esterase
MQYYRKFLLFLALAASLVTMAPAAEVTNKFAKWEKEISAFEAADKVSPPPTNAILFVGSSSIRMWKNVAQDFPNHRVINRGFGGSELEDSVHFFDRIVLPYRPGMIVMYAGTNDINGGKKPERVFDDFKQFVAQVEARLPGTRIAYISVAPNPARWAQLEKLKATNRMISDYCKEHAGLAFIDVFSKMLDETGNPKPDIYLTDKLHMNAKGYAIWKEVVGAYLPKQ